MYGITPLGQKLKYKMPEISPKDNNQFSKL